MITAGIRGNRQLTVTFKETARAFGSGGLEVFGTPSMIALMEMTAATSVQPQLDDGFGTVGISLNVKHTAPTPLGMKVTCESVLTEVDGKRLVFEVTAYDECGVIGSGIHERFIVNNEKFMQKVNEKVKKA